MSSFVSESNERMEHNFQLQAICLHHGDSTTGGHYTSPFKTCLLLKIQSLNGFDLIGLVRCERELGWKFIDDGFITSLDGFSYFLKSNQRIYQPYLLFYKRVNLQMLRQSEVVYLSQASNDITICDDQGKLFELKFELNISK
jgi:hypothetical protein